MPAWPGGPCPICSEYMPEHLVHCQSCRALLNPDLMQDSVELPAFQPLQEIIVMIDVVPDGLFVHCPKCNEQLRISRKYIGQNIQCKLCSQPFVLDLSAPAFKSYAVFAKCPHCEKELRASEKYLDAKVACKHCRGKIKLTKLPEL
ncbi:MAG: hypothetical protein ACKVT0_00390 [Planctomycetaceae bacterium]